MTLDINLNNETIISCPIYVTDSPKMTMPIGPKYKKVSLYTKDKKLRIHIDDDLEIVISDIQPIVSNNIIIGQEKE